MTKTPVPDHTYWAESAKYPVSDWQDEVHDSLTRLGYWEWVAQQEDHAAIRAAESTTIEPHST